MPQNFVKSSPYFCPMTYVVPVKSKVKILQNFGLLRIYEL